jgi:hypothetical protein
MDCIDITDVTLLINFFQVLNFVVTKVIVTILEKSEKYKKCRKKKNIYIYDTVF